MKNKLHDVAYILIKAITWLPVFINSKDYQ